MKGLKIRRVENPLGDVLLAVLLLLLALLMFFVYHFDTDILPQKSPEKIGFIILGDVNEPGWNGSHYQGIRKACEDLGLTLVYRDNVPENSGKCPKAIRELADEGVGMIFLCSYAYAAEVHELVKEYDQIAFATNSGEAHARNLTACFARMYQGRYLAGVLAGMKTKSNVIGYVAAIPNCEVCRGLNAFTLGVRRINPQAKVVVAWTGGWENPPMERESAFRLIVEKNADILTYHQDEKAVADAAAEVGVDFIGYNEVLTGYDEHNLTSVICHWNIFYEDILRRYLKGELNTIQNNWIGMERGAVGLSEYSVQITQAEKKVLEKIRQELEDGTEKIFSGVLRDREGNLRSREGETISDDALLEHMEWLVEGVDVLD